MDKIICCSLFFLLPTISHGQSYEVICPEGGYKGNYLESGITREPETGDTGAYIDQTTIIFTHPVSVGDPALVKYRSTEYPAMITYAGSEFFTISNPSSGRDERYSVHIASEQVHRPYMELAWGHRSIT